MSIFIGEAQVCAGVQGALGSKENICAAHRELEAMKNC